MKEKLQGLLRAGAALGGHKVPHQLVACWYVSRVLQEHFHIGGPVFWALILSVWAWEKTVLKQEGDE